MAIRRTAALGWVGKTWRSSIRFRQTVSLCLVVLLITGLGAAAMVYKQGAMIQRDAEARVLAFSRTFAMMGAGAVLNNLFLIQEAMSRHPQDPGVLEIDVIDPDNMVVAAQHPERIGTVLTDEDWLAPVKSPSEFVASKTDARGSPILVVVEPLFDGERVAAWVRVIYSLADVRREQLKAAVSMAVLALALMMAGILGVSFAQRDAVRRLRAIIRQLREAVPALAASGVGASRGTPESTLPPSSTEATQGELESLTETVRRTTTVLQRQSEAIRESELKFRSVCQSAHDAIISADGQGNIVFWNTGAKRIFGYEEQEVLGKPLTLLMPERYRQAHLRGFARLLSSGEGYVLGKTLELAGLTKVGTEFPLELCIATWETTEGTFFTGIIRDITERKRAEASLRESEERFALAVQGSHDGLWDARALPGEPWSSPGTPVWYSPRFKELLGYGEHEFPDVLGSWMSRLHPEDKDRVLAAIAAHIERNVPYDVEYRLCTKQGEYRWFSARGQAIRDEMGHMLRMAGSLRDITERRRTEEALQALTASLEQKVQERTTELAIARDQALAATRHKSEFLANMSHELRTPLNAVIGFSEVLLERMFGDVNPKQEEYLQDILSSGRHLLTLINDILDLSKIEAGRMELELTTFHLPEVLQKTLALVTERATRHGIRLSLEIDPQLADWTADERKVKQVLLNLLSNAIKFTADGGRIQVRATPAGDSVAIAVSDTGIGIAPYDLPRIFEEFYQARSEHVRKREGTGLGLALAKKFVELHDGRIAVDSEVGRGSTFTFTLPRRVPVEKTQAIPEMVPPARPTGPLALVIEDDATAAKLLSIYLSESDFVVEVVTDAEVGFEKARTLRPAIITLDILMPKVDGWDLLTRLKADPVTANIPVVIVSIVDERGKGFALGAAEYLVKPVHKEELVQAVRRAVSGLRPDRCPATVLVVDDDPIALELMGAILEPEGFAVLKAPHGTQGLQLARDRRPDLIVLDLLMPEMDGFQILDALKQDQETAGIPIVILTMKSLTHEDKERLKGRITHLARKAEFGRSEFVTLIRSLVSRQVA
jgi:PAS domain S-box-containing protein